jgi:hypothetical protein
MDPDPELLFCKRRAFVEFLVGLWANDSIEELLSDRMALEKDRDFLVSIVSGSSAGVR